MHSLGLIFNPLASRNEKGGKEGFEAIKEALGKKVKVYVTESREDIPKALKELREKGTTLLCISGGDGSIQHVISNYINMFGSESLPPIFPLPGGTMNMIAAEAGLKGNQVSLCEKLVHNIQKGKELHILKRGLIKVTDPNVKHGIYSFTWLDGFLYKFIDWYYRGGGGVGTALRLILWAGVIIFISPNHELFREVTSKIYIDGSKLPYESHILIAAGTISRLVFGFRVFVKEAKPGENFSFFYLRSPYLKKAVFQLPRTLYMGLPSNRSRSVINDSAKKVQIEKNAGYVIDGEIYKPDKYADITLEAGPGIRFFTL